MTSQRLAGMSAAAREWFLTEIQNLVLKSPAAAKKLSARMREARQLLAANPRMAQPGLIPGTRRWIVAPYVLILRERNGSVQIVGLRHSAQSDAHNPEEAMDSGVDDEPGFSSNDEVHDRDTAPPFKP
ncbi:MAG: type II toxin-antitoxin system RelE/ParE family toxin [Pseudomonadota bacterium]|uniref:type II toxin-antitoxin system RelE/ParE family toxin n=1 Tax=Tardiphaga sp. TaxID=1926292 RepID=UPI003361FC09